jgi:lambda repressor-like predicted transcriptional regulator
LRPEDVAKIAAAYEAWASAKELGGRFGVHRQTVIAHLEKAGVAIRRGRRLEADEVDEAVRLYEDGWSAARLAKRYGVSDHTIRAALSKRGVELRRRSASEPRRDGRRR